MRNALRAHPRLIATALFALLFASSFGASSLVRAVVADAAARGTPVACVYDASSAAAAQLADSHDRAARDAGGFCPGGGHAFAHNGDAANFASGGKLHLRQDAGNDEVRSADRAYTASRVALLGGKHVVGGHPVPLAPLAPTFVSSGIPFVFYSGENGTGSAYYLTYSYFNSSTTTSHLFACAPPGFTGNANDPEHFWALNNYWSGFHFVHSVYNDPGAGCPEFVVWADWHKQAGLDAHTGYGIFNTGYSFDGANALVFDFGFYYTSPYIRL